MKYRAFCIGYEPTALRLILTKAMIDSLMAGADICVFAPKGVPVGARVDSIVGKRLRCVAHEHHGKIVILEEQES